MKVCVFYGSMPIIVNEIPMKEINTETGLKQGDHLASLFFFLLAEGCIGLMSNAVNRSMFRGFEVGRSGLVISHLQSTHDTLCT